MKLKYVKVVFLNEWMGNIKGSKKEILDRVADVLEDRGTVEIIKEKKHVKTPPSNKMIKDSDTKSNKKVNKKTGNGKKN